MVNTFFTSKIPFGIFSYAKLFDTNEAMKKAIERFVVSVLNGTFERERNEANSHKAYLTTAQLNEWEKGSALKPITKSSAKKETLDPKAFLLEKLKVERHGADHFDAIIASIESSINPARELTKLEEALINFSNEKDRLKITARLLKIEELLKDSPYTSLQFYQDVKDEITKLTGKKSGTGPLFIEDTGDWDALFTCGSAVLGSCQRLDGDPTLNCCLMGYVLDGKTRMLAVRDEEGILIARAIIKILLTSENKPIIFLEGVYSNTFESSSDAVLEFAKERAKAIGIPLYREGTTTNLHSEGCAAPFEYEDGGAGVTTGAYTIMGEEVI